jgi:hypothetical protein
MHSQNIIENVVVVSLAQNQRSRKGIFVDYIAKNSCAVPIQVQQKLLHATAAAAATREVN